MGNTHAKRWAIRPPAHSPSEKRFALKRHVLNLIFYFTGGFSRFWISVLFEMFNPVFETTND